jgi:hypothetical protein
MAGGTGPPGGAGLGNLPFGSETAVAGRASASDTNGDGINEIITIDTNNIYIYQKAGNDLKLLQKIAGKSYDNYLSVDVADIKKTGIKQIFVTSLYNTSLDSFVLEYKDGKYIQTASNLHWFMRVIDTPSGIPMLLCQSYGFNKPFDTPIYEMVWKDGKFIADQKMKIPLGLSVYGLAVDNIGPGGEKIMAFDNLDYLCIFNKTSKPLSRIFTFGFKNDDIVWRSDDQYGGSTNYFENYDQKNANNDDLIENEKNGYVNPRILAINNNGKKEFIIVKNISSVGRILSKAKFFTSSEIYDLEWDGLGMAENWKTKKINGYIADYAIKDIDNDGKPEIVLAIVLSVGSSISDKSVIVYYKLDNIAQ